MFEIDQIMDTNEPIKFGVDLVGIAGRVDGPLKSFGIGRRERVLRRYMNFWRLAKHNPAKPLAPTRDIDAMWHLHMLHPQAYSQDCQAYFGYILGHNPAYAMQGLNRRRVIDIFKSTASLYRNTFNEPYTGGRDNFQSGSLICCLATTETRET
jgi:hypothetical protein